MCLIIQIVELTEVAELRWNGTSELIRVEGPEKTTMKQ